MLKNLHDILSIARHKKVAVGSFNVYNVESLQAVIAAAEAAQSPVIIAFGAAYESHMPLEAMAELVKFYASKSNIPMTLHLDHCRHDQTILRAVKAGFTSVMFDASHCPLDENIQKTAVLTDLVHKLNVSLEGELGYMNEEDGSGSIADCQTGFTKPADARRFVQETSVDALAISIGNAHGLYKGTPTLDLKRLAEIKAAVSVPLVLHGSSGIPLDTLQTAIQLGIVKININTEISTIGIKTARQFLNDNTNLNTRFEAMTKAAEQAMSAAIKKYIDCFNMI